MYSTSKRITAVILFCSQMLTTTSCSSGNFNIPTEPEIAHEHKKANKNLNQGSALIPLTSEWEVSAVEIQDKKEAFLIQPIADQLQLVESNRKAISVQPTYLESPNPLIKQEKPVVLNEQKAVIPYSAPRELIKNTRQTKSTKERLPLSGDQRSIKPSGTSATSPNILVDKQVVSKQSPLMLLAKGGHQVYFDHADQEKAVVIASVPSKADQYPLLQLPFVYRFPNIDLLSLSKQPLSYQQNRVRVCFPSIDKQGIGYVSVEDYGLKGGGRLSIDAGELIEAITRGYGTLGREPETMADWRSFLITFAGGLSSIDLDLTAVNNASSFDPGNMRDMFLHMARNITGRNVQLENYGEAWSRIVGQARNKIRQIQRLNIDPSDYPRGSYTIVLTPNASKMRPFVGEMDRIYSTSNARESVRLNFDNVLGAVDVEINLHETFRFFEERQIERQENERRDQVRRIVDRVVGEVESIEADFINLKNHLQGLNLTDPSSSDDLKKIINTLKHQHEVLMRKLAVLDDLAGADEETRAKRKSLVGKVSAMLDETDRLLRESQGALEKQERERREEEENLECIKFGPDAKVDAVSIYSKRLLARAAKASNNPLLYITSTARDAVSQARAMFNNLERDLDEQRRTYRAPGQAVIDVYVSMKASKASASEIKDAMVRKINELGPSSVSPHCADFNVLNVVDIFIARLSNPNLFKSTIEKYPEVKLLNENKVFHVEIKQP